MKSIKTKLVLSFVGIIVTITLISGVVFLRTSQSTLKEEAENSLIILATESAKLVENRIESLLSTLRMIAMNKDIKNMGWEVDVSILKEEVKKTDFLDIGYVMQNGYTHFADGTVRLMSDREYVSHALEGKEEISDVVLSRVTRSPEVEAAVPVINNGEVVGALVGRMNADSLSEITKDIGYGEKGYSFMINELGTIIAHPNDEYVTRKYNPIEEAAKDNQLLEMANAFEMILDGKAGTTNYVYKENKLFAEYAPIEGTEWTFVITAYEDEIMSALPKMVRIILTVMIVLLILGMGIIFPLDNALTKPLIELTKQSERISYLDIREDIPDTYTNRKDEIGTLSRAFQNLTESLRKITMELNDAAEKVSDTAQELTASSQQSTVTAETIYNSIEDIARGAMDQANNTTSGMDQAVILENKIEINHQCMKNLNTTIGKVTSLVDNGLKDIDKLSIMTNENEAAMKNISDIIFQVKQSSKNIGEASNLISEIARQINLLSLNASIESARAGDAGRGFAVVAQEITNLADRSTVATKSIDESIMELQAKIVKAVEGVERINITSKKQKESVSDTVQKYKEIYEAMEISEKAVEELNTSEEDMKTVKDEIMDKLKALSAIAEENVAITQQVSATMEEQNTAYRVVASVSIYLNDLANQHRTTIRKFKM